MLLRIDVQVTSALQINLIGQETVHAVHLLKKKFKLIKFWRCVYNFFHFIIQQAFDTEILRHDMN